MEWQPISRKDLGELIEQSESRMEPALMALWRRIQVNPVKWQLPPWGDLGGGFWVVGVIGQVCVWYNDIEKGFNLSRYEEFGRIGDYWCDQSELDDLLRDPLDSLIKELCG